jgi:hypothetical protein
MPPTWEASVPSVTVTFCAVFQLDGVIVSVAGAALRSVSLPERATETLTLVLGAEDSVTPKVAVPPCWTVMALGLTRALGPVTVIATGSEVVAEPAVLVATAVIE